MRTDITGMANRAHGWLRDGTVGAFAALITVVSFGLGREVPLLDLFDLGIHELGHLVAAPLPTLAMFLAGSVAQVAFPLAMAAYFGFGRKDLAAAGFCAAWAGTSARDVSVYAGDAVAQRLPLIGGEHDWAYILGPRGFDALHMTDSVAGWIESAGAAMALGGLILVALAVYRSASATQVEGRVVSYPVPAGRRPDPWG